MPKYFALEKDWPKDVHNKEYTVHGPFKSLKATREFLKEDAEELFKLTQIEEGELTTLGDNFCGFHMILKVVEEVKPVIKVKLTTCLQKKITKKSQ